jgi:sugar/nucleoside kinase (ribokinase family)
MNTFLGAAQQLDSSMVTPELIASARILYLEGYLWDADVPRVAMEQAIEMARASGTLVAFTLSDAFLIGRHRADFLRLIESGSLDILFANEVEILQLAEAQGVEAAMAKFGGKVPTLVVTRGEQGAIAVRGDERAEVPAEPVSKLVDTTGAGDLFAAGFLAGVARDHGLTDSLRLGAICAAEVIQHYGARPEADLRALAGDILA